MRKGSIWSIRFPLPLNRSPKFEMKSLTLRKIVRICIKKKKYILKLTISIVSFLRDKDRMVNMVKVFLQISLQIFLSGTEDLRETGRLILLLGDNKTDLRFKLNLFGCILFRPPYPGILFIILYAVLWLYSPNRRRLRGMVYRIQLRFERLFERMFERILYNIFDTVWGVRIMSSVLYATWAMGIGGLGYLMTGPHDNPGLPPSRREVQIKWLMFIVIYLLFVLGYILLDWFNSLPPNFWENKRFPPKDGPRRR